MTTAVGPTILKFVAPVIVAGLRARPADPPPLVVMACENAINATDVLAEHIRERCSARGVGRARRPRRCSPTPRSTGSCPRRPPDAGLDVTVETYFEWAIERAPFGGERRPSRTRPGCDDLAPYIERKLFTVNTGHATTAYHGLSGGSAS